MADELWDLCRRDHFDFCVTRLPHPTTTSTTTSPRTDVLKLPDLHTWSTTIVGEMVVSSSSSNQTNQDPYQFAEWQYGLEWALHMGLPAVLIPPLPQSDDDTALASYARLVEWAAHQCRASGCRLWIPLVPLTAAALQAWRRVLQYSRYPNQLGMLIQFDTFVSSVNQTATAPSTTSTSTLAAAWLAQQLQLLHVTMGSGSLSAISFPCHQFLTNKKGYPTLSKLHQSLFVYALRRVGRRLRFLIQSGDLSSSSTLSTLLDAKARGATGCLPHLQYLQHMRQREAVRTVLDTEPARMETNYLDALQQPLQPLKDHLENQTYHVFEKDPVKYREYQRAIAMALQDRRGASSTSRLVLVVVGAGRGPLVTAALEAYASLLPHQRPPSLTVWAIEKNPSAARRLQALCEYEERWKRSQVKVLQTDLRYLTAQDLGGWPADIVVSELLGSWGCNELSPECLDGLWSTNAVHAHTVSIPTRYTSLVAPVASIKLWQQARQQALYPNASETAMLGITQAMETGYVVRPHEASQMMTAQECWSFQHPPLRQQSTTGHPANDRCVTLAFAPDPKMGIGQGCGYGPLDTDVLMTKTVPPTNDTTTTNNNNDSTTGNTSTSDLSWTLTGLLGSFITLLYQRNDKEGVYLSTCPDQFSVGMFSWFPLYLPIETPLSVPTGATVRTQLWRKVDPGRSVWYEWTVSVWKDHQCLSMSPIHNPGGRSSKVSL